MLTVGAKAINGFDPASTFGTNLVSPFSGLAAKYTTDDGTQVLNAGDTVELKDGYTEGGEAGSTYQYIGPDGAEVDIGTEDYSDTLRWESTTLAVGTLLTFLRTLTTYLDSNFGLDNNLVDSWAQATAVGQRKASIAGAAMVVILEHRASAVIENGAKVNQDATLRTGDQEVVVEAASQNDTINLGGNFQTPGTGLLGVTTDYKTWSPKKTGERIKCLHVRGQRQRQDGGRGRCDRARVPLHERSVRRDRRRRAPLRRRAGT